MSPWPVCRIDATCVACIQPAGVWNASATAGASSSVRPPRCLKARCQGRSPTLAIIGPDEMVAAVAGGAQASATATPNTTRRDMGVSGASACHGGR